MTTDLMARGYLARAIARASALKVYFDARCWPDVVRESQEAVELFLKAALRRVGVEPARTHDVGDSLRASAIRFPEFFASKIPDLAYVSAVLAGDRGPAFYGDERRGIPPDQLFNQSDAERALEQVSFVRELCVRLLEETEDKGA
ncbi:MAG: HEPN domain-containing protein [Myxococcales bacterium]|nr:HEPN domain-containing protein [Myxococcales bacterium]